MNGNDSGVCDYLRPGPQGEASQQVMKITMLKDESLFSENVHSSGPNRETHSYGVPLATQLLQDFLRPSQVPNSFSCLNFIEKYT